MTSRGVSAPRGHWSGGLKAAARSHVGLSGAFKTRRSGSAQTWLMFLSDKGNHLSSARRATITQMVMGGVAQELQDV